MDRIVKYTEQISCSDCDKPLLDVVVIEEPVEKKRLTVSCPYCGGSSFTKEYSYAYKFCPVGHLKVKNVEQDNDIQTIEMWRPKS